MAQIGIDDITQIAKATWQEMVGRSGFNMPGLEVNAQLAWAIQWLKQAKRMPAEEMGRAIARQTWMAAFHTRRTPTNVSRIGWSGNRQSSQATSLHQQVHDKVMLPLLRGEMDIEDAINVLECIVGLACTRKV